MKLHESLTADVICGAVELDDNLGFCVRCGAEHGGCEPDARKYECEECGAPTVYGAEELLFHLEC